MLGSGGLTIGQAGEFDYSGSQAIKARLREIFSATKPCALHACLAKALREQHVQSVLHPRHDFDLPLLWQPFGNPAVQHRFQDQPQHCDRPNIPGLG